jgi:hypothetical protein
MNDRKRDFFEGLEGFKWLYASAENTEDAIYRPAR